MTCWACRLAAGHPDEIRTRLWLFEPGLGICVEDLHAKQYHTRLLFVPAVHIAASDMREADIHAFKDLVEGRVLPSFYQSYPNLTLRAWDLYHHSFRVHWHLQACLL